MINPTVATAALAATLLCGCASSGIQVTPDQLAQFRPGVTTETDVVTKLGKPNAATTTFDGSRTLIYSYVHYQTRPATLIPIVGAFAGGSDTHTNSTIVRFDKDGKFLSFSTTESQFGTGTGLTAGRPIPQTDQPRQAQ